MQERSFLDERLRIIEENYKVIKANIEKAALSVNRNPENKAYGRNQNRRAHIYKTRNKPRH